VRLEVERMGIRVQGMNWVPVKSRMLAAAAYNDDWQDLYLRFHSGDIYCYRGVPVERYQELLACNGPQNLDKTFRFLRWWAALKMKESQCPERARITRPA
jgi:hypothetical protein